MTRFLLDVSTILAFIDDQHQFHQAVGAWAARTTDARWLTSPIVQNGAIRIASQTMYSRRLGGSAVVRRVVQVFCAQPRHEFCPDDISLLDNEHVPRPELLTPKGVTDAYLLALARHHNARFATLDEHVVADVVGAGAGVLEFIPR